MTFFLWFCSLPFSVPFWSRNEKMMVELSLKYKKEFIFIVAKRLSDDLIVMNSELFAKCEQYKIFFLNNMIWLYSNIFSHINGYIYAFTQKINRIKWTVIFEKNRTSWHSQWTFVWYGKMLKEIEIICQLINKEYLSKELSNNN